jgi:hypothetical protein
MCVIPRQEAELTKKSNVVDMALTFTAMIRLFEKGSKGRILDQLHRSFRKLSGVSSREEYESIHLEFCNWFTNSIFTAPKNLNNRNQKLSKPASYGHAAKVLDIAIKVYVHYCKLPSSDRAIILLPLLHGAIDNPIMSFLKSKYSPTGIKAKTIESLEISEYNKLQILISKNIQDEFKCTILPVQYDDIMWHRLNRDSSS